MKKPHFFSSLKQQELPLFPVCGRLREFAGVCGEFAGVLLGVFVAKKTESGFMVHCALFALCLRFFAHFQHSETKIPFCALRTWNLGRAAEYDKDWKD